MTKKARAEQSKKFSCLYPSFFSARLSSIIAIVLLLASIGFLYAKNQELEQKYERQNQPSVLQPISTLTPTPESTPIPTTKPKVYVNPDPIIPCTMSKECGGDIRQVKKSECTNGTCCQIGITWIFYPSRDKCLQDQKASQPIQQPQQLNNPQTAPAANKVPVFLTYGKYTIYCPSQNVDAVKSIDATMTSKIQEWSKNFNDCVEFQRSADPCYKDCYSKMSSANWFCVQSYQSTTPEYKSCTDKVTNDFIACTSGCPNPYTTCQYVYSEQKNMSNQISNLCK